MSNNHIRIYSDTLDKNPITLNNLMSLMREKSSAIVVVFPKASIHFPIPNPIPNPNVRQSSDVDVFESTIIEFGDESYVLHCTSRGMNGRLYKLFSLDGAVNTSFVVKLEFTTNDESEDAILEEKNICEIMKGEYIGRLRIKNKMCHIHKLQYADGDFFSFIEYLTKKNNNTPYPVTPYGWECLEQIYDQYFCLLKHGYFYSDLKIENILVDSFESPKRFFLGDFGSVRGHRTHESPWRDAQNDVSFYFSLLCLNVLFPYEFVDVLAKLYGCRAVNENRRWFIFDHSLKPNTETITLKQQVLDRIMERIEILGESLTENICKSLQLVTVGIEQLNPRNCKPRLKTEHTPFPGMEEF